MPLTKKGEKIMRSMRSTYEDPKKAKSVFYASANAGTIKGVHKGEKKKPGKPKKKVAVAGIRGPSAKAFVAKPLA